MELHLGHQEAPDLQEKVDGMGPEKTRNSGAHTGLLHVAKTFPLAWAADIKSRSVRVLSMALWNPNDRQTDERLNKRWCKHRAEYCLGIKGMKYRYMLQ